MKTIYDTPLSMSLTCTRALPNCVGRNSTHHDIGGGASSELQDSQDSQRHGADDCHNKASEGGHLSCPSGCDALKFAH